MSSRAGPPDPAVRELARQIHALPAARYEFAVFHGSTVRRLWGSRQAIKAHGWLKHRNGRGGHVYLRPATTACVLLDGIDADALALVRDDGFVPAAVVVSAPASLQAWFRLGRELGPDLATCAAQVLAARYGGDSATARFDRLGRAAGFRNRRADCADDEGRYPLVRVLEARGRVTPRADELVAAAQARLDRGRARRATASGGSGAFAGRAASPRHDPQSFLAQELARLGRRYGASTDPARALAAVARRMAVAGFGRDEVTEALAASPRVKRRKPDHAAQYAERMAAWAFGAAVRRPR